MESGLPMSSRVEIAANFAQAYVQASKKDKGRILDQVVTVTGWSRDNARRRLGAAARRPPGCEGQADKPAREHRTRKYSHDALEGAAEGTSGLGGVMRQVLGGLNAHTARWTRTTR